MSIGRVRLLLRNRWMRIVGVSLVMYVLATIDRSNLGMAIPAMRWDLGLSPTAIAFATAAFSWGLLVLQIPAGRIAAVWRPKLLIVTSDPTACTLPISGAICPKPELMTLSRLMNER